MDREETFRTLGLPSDATKEDIDGAYFEGAKLAHPDAGGSEDKFRHLVAARDAALASLNPRAIEPLQVISDLARVIQDQHAADANRREAELARQEKAERRTEAREESRRVSSQIVITHGARYQELSRTAGIAASLSLLATLASANSWLALFPYSAPIFTALTFVLGAVAWKTKRTADDVKLNVETLSERMTERAFISELLYQVLSHCGAPPWSRSALTNGIHDWRRDRLISQEMFEAAMEDDAETFDAYWPKSYFRFRRLRLTRLWIAYHSISRFFHKFRVKEPWEIALLIGTDDFYRLLVAKAVEHGILEEREIHGHGERPRVVYVLSADVGRT